jgi:antitoxin ChpS
MEVKLKKVRSGLALMIPVQLRRSMSLKSDQIVVLEQTKAGLLVRPLSRRRYTLQELLAQCDPQAPVPKSLKEWV